MKKLLLSFLFLFAFLVFPRDSFAQVPAAVSGVLVEYPEVASDGTASFVQASCSWSAVTDATSYNYTITEVDTNTQVQTATVDTSTLRVVFPVTQGRTYRCDVFATNASGSGATGTHSLLCSAEGFISPTEAPTAGPTATPLPTKPPIESPGAFTNTAIILGGVALVIVGGLALILL